MFTFEQWKMARGKLLFMSGSGAAEACKECGRLRNQPHNLALPPHLGKPPQGKIRSRCKGRCAILLSDPCTLRVPSLGQLHPAAKRKLSCTSRFKSFRCLEKVIEDVAILDHCFAEFFGRGLHTLSNSDRVRNAVAIHYAWIIH
jgi:hypothetical protein